jgi:hypothetical protein
MHAHLYGLLGVQDECRHEGAVVGEYPGVNAGKLLRT